jgi:predicted DCC family thiol-disulfide oxidoreductase YuxK
MLEREGALLVYDGDCAFCTASVQWISARWQAPARAVPWQELDPSRLRALGITRDEVAAAAWWIDESGRRSRGHLAIARALAAADGWRSICGRALLVPPLRWIAGCLYPLVVRWRHRLPGGSRACRI